MNKIIKNLSFSLPWDQRIAEIISKPFIFFNIHPNIVTIIGDKDKNPNEDSEVGRVTTIPKGCIKNIKVLCVDCNCNNQ